MVYLLLMPWKFRMLQHCRIASTLRDIQEVRGKAAISSFWISYDFLLRASEFRSQGKCFPLRQDISFWIIPKSPRNVNTVRLLEGFDGFQSHTAKPQVLNRNIKNMQNKLVAFSLLYAVCTWNGHWMFSSCKLLYYHNQLKFPPNSLISLIASNVFGTSISPCCLAKELYVIGMTLMLEIRLQCL